MTLLKNWRAVLSRAWSMKLIGFAAFMDILQNVVPAVSEYMPWWATVIILAVAAAARLLAQKELGDEQA